LLRNVAIKQPGGCQPVAFTLSGAGGCSLQQRCCTYRRIAQSIVLTLVFIACANVNFDNGPHVAITLAILT
jgi:hypothetical protein